MKIVLMAVGKTSFDFVEKGVQIYKKRLTHYLPFENLVIPDIKNAKNLSEKELKNKEGQLILKKIENQDFLILLDENGKQFDSIAFSNKLQSWLQLSHKRVVFLIGGAYGFSDDIYARANSKLSLSKMTFSHQMVRVFAIEQIYRALTIMKNEPYHHK